MQHSHTLYSGDARGRQFQEETYSSTCGSHACIALESPALIFTERININTDWTISLGYSSPCKLHYSSKYVLIVQFESELTSQIYDQRRRWHASHRCHHGRPSRRPTHKVLDESLRDWMECGSICMHTSGLELCSNIISTHCEFDGGVSPPVRFDDPSAADCTECIDINIDFTQFLWA